MVKYFVLGFDRTANNTLHETFKGNGKRSLQASKYRNRIAELPVDDYDAFSGCFFGNFSRIPELYSKYPDAQFIWNIRPTRDTIISRLKNEFHWWCTQPSFKEEYDAGNDACWDEILYMDDYLQQRMQYHSKLWTLTQKSVAKAANVHLVNVEDPEWLFVLCRVLEMTPPVNQRQHESTVDAAALARITAYVDSALAKSPFYAQNQTLDASVIAASMTSAPSP